MAKHFRPACFLLLRSPAPAQNAAVAAFPSNSPDCSEPPAWRRLACSCACATGVAAR
jgi:hypothetical protein